MLSCQFGSGELRYIDGRCLFCRRLSSWVLMLKKLLLSAVISSQVLGLDKIYGLLDEVVMVSLTTLPDLLATA